jgi:capsular polysaccharide biosynthesis protein
VVALQPVLTASDDAATTAALIRIDEALVAGEPKRALAACWAEFRSRPDVRDAAGHSVFLKQTIRCALAAGLTDVVEAFAAKWRAQLPQDDPALEIAFARHHAVRQEHDAARRHWLAALVRDPHLAEAKAWFRARLPQMGFGGLAEFDVTDVTDLSAFAAAGGPQRVVLFGAMQPPPQLPLLNEADVERSIVSLHMREAPVAPVCAYSVPADALNGRGLLVRDGRFVYLDDAFQFILRLGLAATPHQTKGEALDRTEAELVFVDQPVATVIHPIFVWGHFLAEMLPRLYVLSVLERFGRSFPLAVPHGLPAWMESFIAVYVPPERWVRFRPETQLLVAPSFVVPGMMSTEWDWAMHPAFNLMVSDVLQRLGVAEAEPPQGPRLLFLSRARSSAGIEHRLQNEAEVEAALTSLGFASVSPEALDFATQMRLFRGADVIVGEYGSALHGLMFARSDLRIVSINCMNPLQSRIARLRRQRIAYVRPEGGWRNEELRRGSETPLARNFSVDAAALKRTVQDVLDGL